MEEGISMLRSANFPGAIWPVSPKYGSLAGLPAFTSVGALPEGPDAVFLYVPKAITADLLRQLAARGAGGAVCFAAGYAELGEEGAVSKTCWPRRRAISRCWGPTPTAS